jgi:AraC-like DNA-binding protein
MPFHSNPNSDRDSITRVRFTLAPEPLTELRLLNERNAVLPLEPLRDAAVHADITLCAMLRLGILSATLAGVRHGTSPGTGGDDDLYLGITAAGRSVARQGRSDARLMDGDGVLLSAREGFTMTHDEPVQFLGLRLSRAQLANHVDHVDAAVMRPIRRQTTALAWLTRYVATVLADSPLDDPLATSVDVRQLIVNHVYDIVASAVAAARDSALVADGLGIRAARLRAITSYINAHLGSPELSVATVAAHHHITPRYVHKLLESRGTTYSALVLSQRLARVHRMLTDSRFAGRSISALAFDTGFGDLSYFNREFRRRYHATPSEVRRAAAKSLHGELTGSPTSNRPLNG